MQLRDIQYVVMIADKGNFSQAAADLFISQPALSQAIMRLEEELGVSLFARKRNKVLLTNAGELFLKDARQILQLSSHIQKQMSDIQSLKQGTLQLGMTPLFGRFYFAQAYNAYHTLYPNIKIVIYEDNSASLENLLLAGKIDLALLPLPLANNHLEYEQVVSEETFLAVPANHPINHLSPKRASDGFGRVDMAFFQDDDFIMLYPGQRLRELGMQACHAAGFEPRIVFQTHFIDSANALVASGVGISFVPYMIFASRADNGGAVYYHINGLNASRNLVVAYENRNQLAPAALAFIRVICDLLH